MKYDLSTEPRPGWRGFAQRGSTTLTVVIVIVFIAFVTVGMLGSMSKINAGRTDALHKDAATQLANGIIEKARSAKWSEVGFAPGAPVAPGTEAYCTSDIKLNGSGGVRPKDSNGQDTVFNQGAGNAAIVPSSSEVVRGQTYCIRTDVTWKQKPASVEGVYPSGGYGTKTITATVRWYDPSAKVVDEVRVESDRSPTIGEAVPGGISTGETYNRPPAISTDFTPVEATNTFIRWTIGWKNTKKVVVQYSPDASFNLPVTVNSFEITDANLQNQTAHPWTYTTGTDTQKAGYFRAVLTGLDNTQTISAPVFQGMSPTLSVISPDTQATWANTWVPTTVTNKVQRAEGDTGAFSVVAQSNGQSVAIPGVPDGIWRYQLVEESASTGWKINAYSNIVRRDLRRVITQPVLACYQNNYRGDVTVDWQEVPSTWSIEASGSLKITEKGSATSAVATSTARTGSYLFTPSTPASTFTNFDFFGTGDRTGMGTELPAPKTYTVEYTITEPWGTKTSTTDCTVSPDLSDEVEAQAIPPVTLNNQGQKTSFTFDSRHLGLGIVGSDSSKAAGSSIATVKTELFDYTGTGPTGTLVSTVTNTLPSYGTASGKFSTTEIQNPVNGGKYYYKITITPGATGGPARTMIVPYLHTTRDWTYNTNVAPRMFPMIEGDAISIYEVGPDGAPNRHINTTGVGWSPCESMAADVSTTRIYCVFSGGSIYRYNVDSAGTYQSKTMVGTSGWSIFRDIFFVQNFFGDGKPALLAVVGRDGVAGSTEWAPGNILAYRIDANGAPVTPVVVGRGWQNLTMQPIYDYNNPGDMGLFVAGLGDNHPPRIYNMPGNGTVTAPTPLDWNVEVTSGVKEVPNGWVTGFTSLAGMTHDANNRPVLNFDMSRVGAESGGSYTQARFDPPTVAGGKFLTKMVPTAPGKTVSPRRPGSPGNEVVLGPNSVAEPRVGALPGQGDGTTKARLMTTANSNVWSRTPGQGWTLTSYPFTDAGARGVKTDVTGTLWAKLSDYNELIVFQEGQASARTFRDVKDFALAGNTLMMVSTTGVLSKTTGVPNAAVTQLATDVKDVSLSGERYGYLLNNGDFYVASTTLNLPVLQGRGYSKIQVAGQYITGVLESAPNKINWRTSNFDTWQTVTWAAPVAVLSMSQERFAFLDWNGTPKMSEWTAPGTFYGSDTLKTFDMIGATYMDQSDDHWIIGNWEGAWYKYGDLSAKNFTLFTGGSGFRHSSLQDYDNGVGMAGSLDEAKDAGAYSDTVQNVRVRGWAYDREVPKQTVNVGFRITYSDGLVATIAPQVADDLRTDVGATYPVAGSNHGYDFTIRVQSTRGAYKIEPLAYRAAEGAYTQGPVTLGSMWVSPGDVFFTVGGTTTQCMDNIGASGGNQTPVGAYHCVSYDAQNWKWENGQIKLKIGGYIRCLDIQNGNPAAQTATQLYDCNSNPAAQKFEYRPSTKAIYNPVSGMCLDLPNGQTVDYTRFQMYHCNGSAAQQFNINKR